MVWNSDCQAAYETLKNRLVQSPVLLYPDFNESFVLETDPSIGGFIVVLSQTQGDNQLHPVAYASCALTPPDKNYAVTELETRPWLLSGHFHVHLYRHYVVFTDHSAVKAVLETPNPSGKHVCKKSDKSCLSRGRIHAEVLEIIIFLSTGPLWLRDCEWRASRFAVQAPYDIVMVARDVY